MKTPDAIDTNLRFGFVARSLPDRADVAMALGWLLAAAERHAKAPTGETLAALLGAARGYTRLYDRLDR